MRARGEESTIAQPREPPAQTMPVAGGLSLPQGGILQLGGKAAPDPWESW